MERDRMIMDEPLGNSKIVGLKTSDRTEELTAREVIGDKSIGKLVAIDRRRSKDSRTRKFLANSELASVLKIEVLHRASFEEETGLTFD